MAASSGRAPSARFGTRIEWSIANVSQPIYTYDVICEKVLLNLVFCYYRFHLVLILFFSPLFKDLALYIPLVQRTRFPFEGDPMDRPVLTRHLDLPIIYEC